MPSGGSAPHPIPAAWCRPQSGAALPSPRSSVSASQGRALRPTRLEMNPEEATLVLTRAAPCAPGPDAAAAAARGRAGRSARSPPPRERRTAHPGRAAQRPGPATPPRGPLALPAPPLRASPLRGTGGRSAAPPPPLARQRGNPGGPPRGGGPGRGRRREAELAGIKAEAAAAAAVLASAP